MTTTATLPPPNLIGAPAKFTRWRPGQESAIWSLDASSKRFSALVQPTGSGKSLTYAAYVTLSNSRSLILTSTKSLQSQLIADFSALHWRDVRGQSNYVCLADEPRSVADGPCHVGMACELREKGCSYYDAVRRAASAQVVITNYSFWFHQLAASEKIGRFDLIVLDEAHAAPDELADYLAAFIHNLDVPMFLAGSTPPPVGWAAWAGSHIHLLKVRIDNYKTNPGIVDASNLRRAKDLLVKLERLAKATESLWVMERQPKGWKFDPVWPAPYAEETLFRGTPRVVFVSATIRRKTLQLLGLKPTDYDFLEYPSTFPVARRPVIHVPTIRLTFRSTPEQLAVWVSRIDQIISRRLDRKGVIHCVSYARRDLILRYSKYRALMITHNTGEQANALAQFRASASPRVFVSPSATTGLDFPYDDCEYQIIGKVPFPDSRSAILKARQAADKQYGTYLAMIELVQAVGRGMRAQDDQCETLVIDDNFTWFVKHYSAFAPRWFIESIRYARTVPDPLPKLTVRAPSYRDAVAQKIR